MKFFANFFRKSERKEQSLFEKRFHFQNELDKKLLTSLLKKRVPSLKQIKYITRFFSKRELQILKISLVVFFISVATLGINYYIEQKNNAVITDGLYIEGVVGSPRVINPLYYGLNEGENDVIRLVYSSLFKRGTDGKLVPDVADKIEESKDGKTYTITLRSGVKWHNYRELNTPELNADDVVFSFKAITDPQYKSTLFASFIGVEIEKIEDEKNNKIKFTLTNPYAGFKELLTFGILPAEIWQQIDPADVTRAEASNKPIGSGPYKVINFSKNTNGRIQEYNLEPNKEYYAKAPFLEVRFRFYASVDEALGDFQQGKINGLGDLPIEYLLQEEINADKYNIRSLDYPKMTAVFFNQKVGNKLAEQNIRTALTLATDKSKLIPEKLKNHISIINSPIASDSFAYDNTLKDAILNIEQAKKLLDEAGWKPKKYSQTDIDKAAAEIEKANDADKKKLANIIELGTGEWRTKNDEAMLIDLAVINRPTALAIADELVTQWSAIGIKVKVNAYENNEINTTIKAKNFDALLYSIIQSADPDPYIFWHSTQIDNGLNITSLNNKDIDKLLEDARQTSDQNQRIAKYKKFQELINEEKPAIFLFSSKYIYIQDKKINGQQTEKIIQSSDRLNDANEWYLTNSKIINWSNSK